MAHHKLAAIALILGSSLTMTACFNSESEYQAMVEQREALKVQLDAASRENEILTEALNDIRREQENLRLLANTARSQISGGTGSSTSSLPPTLPSAGGSTSSATEDVDAWGWAIPPDAWQDPAPAATASTTAPPERASSGSGQIYRPRPGDVLSTIAARHNTTVSELVRLNPYLRNRRNYMIWESDEIQLP